MTKAMIPMVTPSTASRPDPGEREPRPRRARVPARDRALGDADKLPARPRIDGGLVAERVDDKQDLIGPGEPAPMVEDVRLGQAGALPGTADIPADRLEPCVVAGHRRMHLRPGLMDEERRLAGREPLRRGNRGADKRQTGLVPGRRHADEDASDLTVGHREDELIQRL